MATKQPARELLGEVTCPSGVLLVIDFGLLNMWSHDRPPRIPDGLMNPELTAHANAGADYRFDGPDAERAGHHWDRQWHPRYVYDIPRHGIESFEQSFAAFVVEHKYDAKLVRLPERVPHRTRVDRATEHGRGAGSVFFNGIEAVAITGLPTGQTFRVHGQRMPPGDPIAAGLWQWIDLDVRSKARVATRERIGVAWVDKARLMLVDADALGGWEHDRPLDGKADFVFWGRDAQAVAEWFSAPRIDDANFGWLDRDIYEVVELGTPIEQAQADRKWRFATDFRPHSHHHALLQRIKQSGTESGTLEFGGATACGFMTSWGDGLYPVWREFDAKGQLVRVRLQMGDQDRVELLYKVMEQSRRSP